MKRCPIASVTAIMLIWPALLAGQDIPVGSWRYHHSYENARLLTGSEEVIFCASENGLYSFTAGAIETITKNDGLSNVAQRAIAYDPTSGALIVGYDDSVIDFIFPDRVVAVDDLKSLDFGVPKGISKITVNLGTAYAATSFGIVSISVLDQQIAQIFTEIGPGGSRVAVKDILIQSGIVYALTDIGILVGSLDDNLLDFNNWSLISEPLLDALESYQGNILTRRANRLFTVNTVNLTLDLLLNVPYDVVDVGAEGDLLFLLGESELSTWDGQTIAAIATESVQSGSELLVFGDLIWIADGQSGLVRKAGSLEERIVPNGPVSDDITHIKFEQDLFSFYAPPPGSNTTDSSGYSVFGQNGWSNESIEGFYNISDVGSLNEATLLSSNGFGVYDLQANVAMDLGLPDDGKVAALLTRNDGTWVLPFRQQEALLFLEREGGILRFDSGTVGTNRATFLQQSEAGSVWLTQANSAAGIYIYNPIEQLRRRITTADDLPSNVVRDIVLDLEDEAWIATANGLVFFPDGSFVFDDFGAITPIFENDVLLEGENITALAVDGGNRKWVGTDKGVWVFSRNVDQLDLRFTAADSPLPSDEILEFAYDPASGEMFILTTRGLCSYQTGSSAGGLTHTNVSVFPNPVYPHDVGPVTLKGLAQNAIVKVTDINGRLVSEIEALGGTATWDLRDVTGSAVVGGVYLLFSSTADGEDSFVGKVALIR